MLDINPGEKISIRYLELLRKKRYKNKTQVESRSSCSCISWKFLFSIQSFIIVILFTYYYYKQRPNIFRFNAVMDTSVSVLNTTRTTPIKNFPRNCCDMQKLLEKCSTSDFVTIRAKYRAAFNKKAIFTQADRVINLGGNYFISVDDILFGYDYLFELDLLYTAGSWLGAQFQSSPQDAMVLQQLIWRIKPDLIIDFGTNAGGSALFFASIMSFYSDNGTVLTVDVKPFSENWMDQKAVKCQDCVNPSKNKLWKKYVQFIEGSTTDPNVIDQIKEIASKYTKVFFSHDSDHKRDIVYQDLVNYAELVSVDSYLVVQDTKMDRLFNFINYNGPLSAVKHFLNYQKKTVNRAKYTFVVDRSVEIYYYTQHPHGWLKRIS